MISNKYPDNVALITRDRQFTYRQFMAHTHAFAELFNGKKYERIAILSENRPEWLFACYASWLNSSTVVTIDFLSAPADIAYILSDCRPSLVFASATTRENLKKASQLAGYRPEIIDFDMLGLQVGDSVTDWEFKNNKEDIAVIIYTSGTTGNPKGVMLSFGNLEANIDAVTRDVPIFTAGRQVLLILPLHHIFPLAGNLLAPLIAGGTIVMSPSMQSSDIREMLGKNAVNILLGVPRFYELLYKGIRSRIDASLPGRVLFRVVKAFRARGLARKIFGKVHESLGGHIEMMISGGAALNPEVGRFFQVLGFEVLEGYGMTEAAPMITFPRPGKAIIGTTGQALPGLQIEIRDGEIVAKGPNIMKGYFNKPDETAEALKDGWLYTGDLGEIDRKGYLRITGRKKELIVLPNGKNVSPFELEQKLEHMAACVHEAGIFLHKEQLHAVILPDFTVLASQGIRDADQYFRDHVIPDLNKELTSYKRIMQFTLVRQELPKTRLGKLQRYRLAELTESRQSRQKGSEEPSTEEYLAVKSFLESQVDMDISPDDHLEYDIALDSLGKLSLIDYIEKTFGVKIDEEHLRKFPSIRQMVNHIRENKKWHHKDVSQWSTSFREKVHVKLPKAWVTMALFKEAAKNFFSLYFRFRREGYHDVPDGPCIIAPNHQSFIDGLFVIACIKGRHLRDTFFYAKKKHVNNRFLRFLASKNNVIVMDINKDLNESIQKLADVLQQGKKVVIFPEGTRTRTGRLGEFKKTFAMLSKELDIPVVPVAISGAYKAMPGKAVIPRPFARVRVSFLQPVYPRGLSADRLMEKVRNAIERKVNA